MKMFLHCFIWFFFSISNYFTLPYFVILFHFTLFHCILLLRLHSFHFVVVFSFKTFLCKRTIAPECKVMYCRHQIKVFWSKELEKCLKFFKLFAISSIGFTQLMAINGKFASYPTIPAIKVQEHNTEKDVRKEVTNTMERVIQQKTSYSLYQHWFDCWTSRSRQSCLGSRQLFHHEASTK